MFLGYTRRCKDNIKKFEAVVQMDPPRSKKEVLRFIRMINYYRYMWAMRSHKLQGLTQLMALRIKFGWISVKQENFDEMKRTGEKYILLEYTNFNKHFDFNTGANNHQLGSVIIQEGTPIYFCIRKITGPHTMFTVM